MTKLLLILFLVACCGDKINEKEFPEIEEIELLRLKFDTELKKLSGWPKGDDCDKLLWVSLAKYAGVRDIDIMSARDDSGAWHRTPEHTCYKEGRSRSTISNDMFVGLFLVLDKVVLKEIIDYGKAHYWTMGKGDPGAHIMKPQVQALLGFLAGEKLGERVPLVWSDKDYVRHIQSLMLYQWGKKSGFLYTHERRLLESYSKNDYLPKAVLFRYKPDDNLPGELYDVPEVPSYVRGHKSYKLVHWLFSVKLVLENYESDSRNIVELE